MHGEKTKALICCAVTAQLICTFDFAYLESRFSRDAAHINFVINLKLLCDNAIELPVNSFVQQHL